MATQIYDGADVQRMLDEQEAREQAQREYQQSILDAMDNAATHQKALSDRAKAVLAAARTTLEKAEQTNAEIAEAKARNEALIQQNSDIADKVSKIAAIEMMSAYMNR